MPGARDGAKVIRMDDVRCPPIEQRERAAGTLCEDQGRLAVTVKVRGKRNGAVIKDG